MTLPDEDPRSPVYPTVMVKLAELQPHPRNYRIHPEDQIVHLRASIREHGMYRNVVAAKDLTILAGHGVTIAAGEEGFEEIPVIVLPIGPNDPAALRILAGDNELGLRAEINDRGLSEILKDLRDANPDDGLLGTGYDDRMLASLIFVTRPASEIADLAAAAQWLGLPEFDAEEGGSDHPKIVVHFDTEEKRAAFMERIGATVIQKKTNGTWSLWWPEKTKEDLSSLRFEEP